MINTKLDTRFNNFLQESKEKLKDLGQEIEFLTNENQYLEQQVSATFHGNTDIGLEVKKFEEQLKRFKQLNSVCLAEIQVFKEREDRAKKDLDNLTNAYKTQTELAVSEKKALVEKERVARFYRKANDDVFREKKMDLDHRIEELQNEIMLKTETNQSLNLELSNSDSIESEILSTIKAELMSLTSRTSSSFNPRRTK